MTDATVFWVSALAVGGAEGLAYAIGAYHGRKYERDRAKAEREQSFADGFALGYRTCEMADDLALAESVRKANQFLSTAGVDYRVNLSHTRVDVSVRA